MTDSYVQRDSSICICITGQKSDGAGCDCPSLHQGSPSCHEFDRYACVLQCVAVCASVLQCGAVCCSVLQRGAAWCSVLGMVTTARASIKVHCSVLQRVAVCVAVCCIVLHCVAVWCSVLGSATARASIKTPCSVLQCVAVCFSMLQHGAVCWGWRRLR